MTDPTAPLTVEDVERLRWLSRTSRVEYLRLCDSHEALRAEVQQLTAALALADTHNTSWKRDYDSLAKKLDDADREVQRLREERETVRRAAFDEAIRIIFRWPVQFAALQALEAARDTPATTKEPV